MTNTLQYLIHKALRFISFTLYSICSTLAPFFWTVVQYLWPAFHYIFNLVFPMISYLCHLLAPIFIKAIYFLSPMISYVVHVLAPILNFSCATLISTGEYLGIWSAAKSSLVYAAYNYPMQVLIISLLSIIALSVCIQPLLFCVRTTYFILMSGLLLTQSLMSLAYTGLLSTISYIHSIFPNKSAWLAKQPNRAAVKANEILEGLTKSFNSGSNYIISQTMSKNRYLPYICRKTIQAIGD